MVSPWNLLIAFSFIFMNLIADAKEIAFTFDDAPMPSSRHFESLSRTEELIKKLKALGVPSAFIFANACKRKDQKSVLQQLRKYKDAGHSIGNHTCSHPRLDEVGYSQFSQDAEHGDRLLSSLFSNQKFFRFPYLNEGKDEKLRDQMRIWLKDNHYRNAVVSVDDDDYIFSFEINAAKNRSKKIDYKKVQALFLRHMIGAVDFYDNLAVKTLGYSPKHVLLLHEMDATVMFLDSLVKELHQRGWKIISAEEAYQDKIYFEQPQNTYANHGIIAQLAMQKNGERNAYDHFDEIKSELKKILGLK